MTNLLIMTIPKMSKKDEKGFVRDVSNIIEGCEGVPECRLAELRKSMRVLDVKAAALRAINEESSGDV